MRTALSQIARFFTSGGLSALVNLAVLFVFVEVLQLWYLSAAVGAFTAALVVNFLLQKHWVFHKHTAPTRREALQFAGLALGNLVANVLLLALFVEVLNLWYLVAQVIALALLALVNFVVYQHFIFKTDGADPRRTRLGTGILVALVLAIVWFALHTPAMLFGTQDVFVYRAYMGDEQSPITGALHMLEAQNPLGVRDAEGLYYGPLFATIAVPAVAADAAVKLAAGEVRDAESYRENLLFDWATTLPFARALALLAGLSGLLATYLLFMTRTLNPARRIWPVWVAVALLATNFYYFEYANFFRHWAFIVPLSIWQLYLGIRILETNGRAARYWIWHGLATVALFGISYVGVLYAATLLPVLVALLIRGVRRLWQPIVLYAAGVAALSALLIVWYPDPFIRLLGFLGLGSMGGDPTLQRIGQNPLALSMVSFGYYGMLVFLNHIALVIIAVVLGWYLWARERLFTHPWIWMFILLGALNFFFFAFAVHHEGRYMLPTIVALVFVAGGLLVRAAQYSRPRLLSIVIIILLAWTIVFHGAHIGKWIVQYGTAPDEQRIAAMLADRQARAGAERSAVLIVSDEMVGYPHTRDSYAAYAATHDVGPRRHYTAIIEAARYPAVPLLRARYVSAETFGDAQARRTLLAEHTFSHIVTRHIPARAGLHTIDFIDGSLVRIWWAERFDTVHHIYTIDRQQSAPR